MNLPYRKIQLYSGVLSCLILMIIYGASASSVVAAKDPGPCTEVQNWVSKDRKQSIDESLQQKFSKRTPPKNESTRGSVYYEVLKELKKSESELLAELSRPDQKLQKAVALGKIARKKFGYEPYVLFQMRGLQNARNFLSAMGLTDKVPTPSLKITEQAVKILSEHREFFENWADLAKNAASLQGKAECEAFQSKLKKLSKKTPQAIREWLGS